MAEVAVCNIGVKFRMDRRCIAASLYEHTADGGCKRLSEYLLNGTSSQYRLGLKCYVCKLGGCQAQVQFIAEMGVTKV